MSYQNAKDILPKEIVTQIQQYIQGETIYIPKKTKNKKGWGENTDTLRILTIRNQQIYAEYQRGLSIFQLSQKYFLVERSIQRIILQEKRKSLL